MLRILEFEISVPVVSTVAAAAKLLQHPPSTAVARQRFEPGRSAVIGDHHVGLVRHEETVRFVIRLLLPLQVRHLTFLAAIGDGVTSGALRELLLPRSSLLTFEAALSVCERLNIGLRHPLCQGRKVESPKCF